MKTPKIPKHMHRSRDREWTPKEKLKQAQRQYEAMRIGPVKITLTKAPWEKEENKNGPDNSRL